MMLKVFNKLSAPYFIKSFKQSPFRPLTPNRLITPYLKILSRLAIAPIMVSFLAQVYTEFLFSRRKVKLSERDKALFQPLVEEALSNMGVNLQTHPIELSVLPNEGREQYAAIQENPWNGRYQITIQPEAFKTDGQVNQDEFKAILSHEAVHVLEKHLFFYSYSIFASWILCTEVCFYYRLRVLTALPLCAMTAYLTSNSVLRQAELRADRIAALKSPAIRDALLEHDSRFKSTQPRLGNGFNLFEPHPSMDKRIKALQQIHPSTPPSPQVSHLIEERNLRRRSL